MRLTCVTASLSVLLLTACATDGAGGGSGSSQSEKNEYARQMCDTNEGGYYHVDQDCYRSYGGR